MQGRYNSNRPARVKGRELQAEEEPRRGTPFQKRHIWPVCWKSCVQDTGTAYGSGRTCSNELGTGLARVGLQNHWWKRMGGAQGYGSWEGAENEQRNFQLLWERSFWNRNSTRKAELSQWQEGWTNKESPWQWKGKTGLFYYVVYTGCSLRHPVLWSSMEKRGPPLPGCVRSNIHERKAILLLNQGSSILVALTILPSPLGPPISQSETSLTVWLNATLSA